MAEYQKENVKCKEDDIDHEHEEGVEMETLNLSSDIYSLTFHQFVHSRNPKVHQELVMKSAIAFAVQVLLAMLIFMSSGGLASVFNGDVSINCARLLCAFILHFQVLEEITMALDMMMYVKHNSHTFKAKGALLGFIVALMKVLGGLVCEVANILVIVQSETVGDVIKDFIAFGIIQEIDDIIASTVGGTQDPITDQPLEFPASQKFISDLDILRDLRRSRTASNLASLFKLAQIAVYNTINFIYVTIYFYFMPFSVILVVAVQGQIAKSGQEYKEIDPDDFINNGNFTDPAML